MHYDVSSLTASSPHRYLSMLAYTIQKATLTPLHVTNDIAQLTLRGNHYPNSHEIIEHWLS